MDKYNIIQNHEECNIINRGRRSGRIVLQHQSRVSNQSHPLSKWYTHNRQIPCIYITQKRMGYQITSSAKKGPKLWICGSIGYNIKTARAIIMCFGNQEQPIWPPILPIIIHLTIIATCP